MANDLEAFLKRAAEKRRRALEAVEQQTARRVAPPPAKTTANASDRMSRQNVGSGNRSMAPQPAAIPALPVPIDVTSSTMRSAPTQSISTRSTSGHSLTADSSSTAPCASVVNPTAAVADLMRRLHSPEGLRDAVILKEILDRPTDRW